MDDKEIKKLMKPEFAKNYEKYYPVQTLTAMGYHRRVCKKCGRGFWTQVERDFCDEAECSGGYRFIGESLTRKKFEYKEAWDTYVKTFEQWGYVPLERYPTVCRWYEDLYFVAAGINDFQPYVVSGEIEPPARAVLEPQFCLRFNDIDNVGITGRHYTGFIMVGQHTFNTPEKHVYFKEEGIGQIQHFLTQGLGIPAHEIVFHEDVWAGGGNFGPSIEYFSRGLELGNQVYMQYEQTPDGGFKELRTKVIDMGAGLERWAWFSQGCPMSYDATFPKTMEFIYNKTGYRADPVFHAKFAKYAGILNVEEIEDVGSAWNDVAKSMEMDLGELKDMVYKIRAQYVLADHTRSLLVAIHDGALPSNVGGGYNLRNLLRRCWSLIDQYQWDIDLNDIFRSHIDEFGSWYTELKDYGSLFDIIDVERKRYEESRRKSKDIIKRMVKAKETLTADKLVELYDSQGISPELIKEAKPDVVIPEDFYARVQARHDAKATRKIEVNETQGLPKTEPMYYEKPREFKFEANVVKLLTPTKLVLDRTLFYPLGGGQAGDTGFVNGIKVKDVYKQDGVIIHVLESPMPPDTTKVIGEVDEARRRILAAHHSATHIVNYAARKVLGDHVWQAGAEKTPEKARLDITHYESLTFQQLQEIERVANDLAMKQIPVVVREMSRTEAEMEYSMRIYQGGAVPGKILRIIVIDGYDVEACGGIHVDNTSKVGFIKMLSSERIQDGVVRLEFKSLDNAVSEIQHHESILREVSDLWGVGYDDIPKTAQRFFNEWKELGKKNKELQAELVQQTIAAALGKPGDTVDVVVTGADFGTLMKAVGSFKKEFKGRTVIFRGDNFAYGYSDLINVKEKLAEGYVNVDGSEHEAKAFKAKPKA
ncbi:alanine--tRNA ligase [Methanocella arvoryzae]|uniref:Alanine--tRNA ligase n=1 Tax=Methanocella arvoryzae (strain DSM 22066 / NBRC 105507 / MRE50) TaxID=351160 RepID=SYA_METAR|nr:alanine--tRNA ligase [Methanocella arvoryzae]Q0W5Q9.1 RecName: Full=Alanine--tRNA ligase; AltName: Full=Alanyl-tRNA synthetase; Short=AlaRS [Methanocella arvoryzae MRE50]CAJ36284.1 alanyl-tRNA synthetase [Methanocella arvoryzae MRE50]